MAKNVLSQRSGTCELTVLRDPGMLGGGVAALLYIDRSPAATLKPGEILTVWLPAGYHTFGLLPKFNLLGLANLREFDYEIKQTRRNSIRVGMTEDGPVFVPTSY